MSMCLLATAATAALVSCAIHAVQAEETNKLDVPYRIIERDEVVWAWGKLEGKKGSARPDNWTAITQDHILYDNANLTKLTFLNVELQTLLPSHTLPPQLKDVAIVNCALPEIPTDMLYMTHLEKLDLSRNNLADLNLTALVTSTSYPYLLHLTVQENALRSFDISAPSLVQLDLTGNQLTELPRCIYTMIDLLELYLANNSIPLPLHVTPYEFEFLSGLDYFYMDSVDSIVCNGDGSQLHMLKGNKICVTAHASGESAPASPPSDDTSWSYSTLSWILLVSGIIEAVVGVAVFMAYRKQKSHKWAALQHSYTTTASSGERERLLSVEHVIYASMEAWTSKTPLSEALEAEALRLDCDALSLDVRLAQGGYGEVWRGHYHHSLVAIKLLLPEKRAPADIEAFMREIVLLASLNHRHILQFLGVAWPKSKRDLMLVTEYVAGGDLRVLLDADPSRPWSQRKVQFAIDIAVAMEYLHALDIVHRDIKAKNVLVDAEHGAKLCDFGVAVHVYTLVGDGPDQQPATQGGFGTSRWIAPEVLSGERFTKAADVYAFGIVLSELDSHQIPYAHARTASGNDLTNVAILSQVVKGTMTPEFQDTCPDQVLHLARYCLHPNPKARPTASAVVGRLLEVVLPPCDVDSSTSQL